MRIPPSVIFLASQVRARCVATPEARGRLIGGVEVKASSTVGESGVHGLNRLRDATGAVFHCGIVLYDGDSAWSFGHQMFAVPIAELWAAQK